MRLWFEDDPGKMNMSVFLWLQDPDRNHAREISWQALQMENPEVGG